MPERIPTLSPSTGPSPSPALAPPVPFAAALRKTLRGGYNLAALRADAGAGVVVGIVALPLSMALAIAVGVPPQHGLYTAVIAGAVVALTGGSKFQITGPTAAFVVILAPIVGRYGLGGLLTAGLLAGILLLGMGIARLGRLIEYIPHPVTTGFTAGIAVVIATLQIKDLLGLKVGAMPDHFTEKLGVMWGARESASLAELGVGLATLFLLWLSPKILTRVPGPLVAIGTVAVVAAIAHRIWPAFSVATIGSRFHTVVDGKDIAGIPPVPPQLMLPWGERGLTFAMVRELLPSAFAIAMLGAIESLLSAVIADGMTGKRHDPNAELVGLGIGNVLAPLFGGIAATGALARTATNVRAGARSPFSAVIHSAFVLVSIVLLARVVAFIPMAALAGLLLRVAWNMSEARHFVHIARVAPKSDVFVMLLCFFLTVVFDMVIAVTTGVLLAALLFMRRMAELTESRTVLHEDDVEDSSAELPAGVALYEIRGPLFFGAAQNAMGEFERIGSAKIKVLILDLGRVPTIDATGLVALESAFERVRRSKKRIVVAGPLPEPARVFDKSELKRMAVFAPTRDAAIALATELGAARDTVPPSSRQGVRST